MCKIMALWTCCQTSFVIVTYRKLISLGWDVMPVALCKLEFHICYPSHMTQTGPLNGAGAAGVADLLWAASLSEPPSMRALLAECVFPMF